MGEDFYKVVNSLNYNLSRQAVNQEDRDRGYEDGYSDCKSGYEKVKVGGSPAYRKGYNLGWKQAQSEDI